MAGHPVDRRIEADRLLPARRESGLALRSGCFCNPGAGEAAFGLEAADIEPILRRGVRTFDGLRAGVRAARGFDIGCLRASFGIVSDFSDAWRLVRFLAALRDSMADGAGGLLTGAE
ncbi:MAG: hypothetical protein EBZ59_03130 [Planctomycetia bacterium]|nr:hypothetical protein [Planctomycetia bacterium]